MENKNIVKDFSQYILERESVKIVGILCKRIDLLIKNSENKNTIEIKDLINLKLQIKELIYESYRNLRDMIDTGKVAIKLVFNNREDKNG